MKDFLSVYAAMTAAWFAVDVLTVSRHIKDITSDGPITTVGMSESRAKSRMQKVKSGRKLVGDMGRDGFSHAACMSAVAIAAVLVVLMRSATWPYWLCKRLAKMVKAADQ